MGFLIAGILSLLIASFCQSYCAIGILASPVYAPPRIFDRILLLGWIILFVVGIVLLFFANWIWAIVGAFVYWFLLPLFVEPVVKRWMLPSWDDLSEELKGILGIMGYNKRNYRDGNWWRRDMAQREWNRLMRGE